jgi:hypothetical protein
MWKILEMVIICVCMGNGEGCLSLSPPLLSPFDVSLFAYQDPVGEIPDPTFTKGEGGGLGCDVTG